QTRPLPAALPTEAATATHVAAEPVVDATMPRLSEARPRRRWLWAALATGLTVAMWTGAHQYLAAGCAGEPTAGDSLPMPEQAPDQSASTIALPPPEGFQVGAETTRGTPALPPARLDDSFNQRSPPQRPNGSVTGRRGRLSL